MNLIDFLLPRSCVFCGVQSEGSERNICRGCFDDLPWREPPISPSPGPFVSSVSMLQYAFPVDVALKAFKFNRKLFYAPAFAEILCTAQTLLPSDIDAVLPVPLHWRRKTRRGFNQATEIAKPLAKVLDVPLLHGLKRTKATPFQSGLDAKDRRANLRGAFRVTGRVSQSHILIVDDVLTTGTTVRALARILSAHGVSDVSVLTVARAG